MNGFTKRMLIQLYRISRRTDLRKIGYCRAFNEEFSEEPEDSVSITKEETQENRLT